MGGAANPKKHPSVLGNFILPNFFGNGGCGGGGPGFVFGVFFFFFFFFFF